MTERKSGNSRLVYNKATRTIDTVKTSDQAVDIDAAAADISRLINSRPKSPTAAEIAAVIRSRKIP